MRIRLNAPECTYVCAFKWIGTGLGVGVAYSHVCTRVNKEMAAEWTSEETKALIGIWGKEEVQNALDCVVRNKTIYQKIAASMASLGYVKTWQQCRTKVNNLVQKYKKVSIIAVDKLTDIYSNTVSRSRTLTTLVDVAGVRVLYSMSWMPF